ncbi:unnamed protein product [Tenebrio molitor]|nr:unnamed protein product [Tenebrio molitor]
MLNYDLVVIGTPPLYARPSRFFSCLFRYYLFMTKLFPRPGRYSTNKTKTSLIENTHLHSSILCKSRIFAILKPGHKAPPYLGSFITPPRFEYLENWASETPGN